MNQKEWEEFCKIDKAKAHYWYNKVTKKRISKEFESDPRTDKDAKVIHHLRDTEEQRKYNDEHYEMFGFEIDENGNEHFEYGKYVVFWTKEHHNKYHKDSDETRHKKSVAGKIRWQDTLYRDHMIKAIREVWSDEHRIHKRSEAYSGEGNPFYGKHHSQETKEKYFIGKSNPMYGVIQSEETRNKISKANKGRVVSDYTRRKISNANLGHEVSEDTRNKISIANSGKVWSDERRLAMSEQFKGEGNPFYGKHHSDETKEKYFIGENNPMYGKHHTDESKYKISEANKCKIVSDDTRNKLSVALSGERNGMYGKRPPEGCWNKAKYLQEQASIAYRNHKNNGGTTPWIEFRREYMRAHKNDIVA